jgi:hypothetical protein
MNFQYIFELLADFEETLGSVQNAMFYRRSENIRNNTTSDLLDCIHVTEQSVSLLVFLGLPG